MPEQRQAAESAGITTEIRDPNRYPTRSASPVLAVHPQRRGTDKSFITTKLPSPMSRRQICSRDLRSLSSVALSIRLVKKRGLRR
jgi:hypothetical protein